MVPRSAWIWGLFSHCAIHSLFQSVSPWHVFYLHVLCCCRWKAGTNWGRVPPSHRFQRMEHLQHSLEVGVVIANSTCNAAMGYVSSWWFLPSDSSVETQYTDSTGVDLENFIKMTLNKNRNDRVMLLRLENDMINYIKESKWGTSLTELLFVPVGFEADEEPGNIFVWFDWFCLQM